MKALKRKEKETIEEVKKKMKVKTEGVTKEGKSNN